jgi:hypothetical protein
LVSHKQSPNIKAFKWLSATRRRGEDMARMWREDMQRESYSQSGIAT